MITQGLGSGEIADRMFTSINTVKTYIRTAYRKIGVNSRTRAVLWGVDHASVPTPSWPRRPTGRPERAGAAWRPARLVAIIAGWTTRAVTMTTCSDRSTT